MGDKLIESVTTIGVAIIGIAIIAVLVSRQANTSGVISAAGSAFGADISAAVSPITGGQFGGLNSSTFNLGGGANLPSTF